MADSLNKMDVINDLIEKAKYKDATNLFLSVIETTNKDYSSLLAEYGYNYAHLLFELQEYELCLKLFQSVHHFNYKQEDIEEFLYASFIFPNEAEFTQTYDQHIVSYADNIIASHIPSNEELCIDFIPYEEDKYLMFNKKLKVFEGFIDISEDALNSFELTDSDNEFSDIVITDSWNMNIYKNIILSFKDRILYFVSHDFNSTLSFLKLPGIMEHYLSNLKIIDSLDSFQSYFHTHTSVYFPRTYYGRNTSSSGTSIAKILEEEHRYRLTPEGRNTSNILLTIGIPSYNRGHRVLQNIRNLLQLQYDAEIEFVISNNGSGKYTEEYEEIEKIQDSRIHYYRFPENMGANTNFCQVLNISQGKYTCLLSDEDAINLPAITHYLHVFRYNPNISFTTSRGLNYYTHNSCHTYKMGNEAFLQSFLNTNYVSGLIYQTELIHNLNIPEWTMKHISTNKGVYYYSQSCWVMFLTLCGDYYEDNTLLFMEGRAEDDQIVTSVGTDQTAKPMLPYTTLESRVAQHNGFIEVLNQFEALLDKGTYLTAYLRLCDKTIFLLSLVKSLYISAGASWDTICNEVEKCCNHGISKLSMKLEEEYKAQLITKIDEIISYYRD
jgi:hypothetical protein